MIPLITIDGLSGSGKTTLTYRLARKLKWHFLNSGGLYRALAYKALADKIDLQDEAALLALLPNLAISFAPPNEDAVDQSPRLILNQSDITREAAMEACTSASSQIATLPGIRHALLEKQRAFWQPPGLIAEGRDMGTVVFPEAPLKLFLLASNAIRAQRRQEQLKQMGINVSLGELACELAERDARDKARKTAPLKPASDAVIIDTTALTTDETLAMVLTRL